MADIGTATLDLKVLTRGTTTMRTAAGQSSLQAGTLFYDETLDAVYEWNGSSWQLYGPMGGASGGNTPATGVPGSIVRCRATLAGVSPGVIAAAGDYTAGDVLNNSTSAGVAWQMPGVGRLASGGMIAQKLLMTLSVAAITARFRLHFFNAAPTVVQNDNAALLLDLDDRASYIGFQDMPAMQTTGSSEYCWSELDMQWITQLGAATNFWFFVQTLDGITNESAGMTMDIFMTGVQS